MPDDVDPEQLARAICLRLLTGAPRTRAQLAAAPRLAGQRVEQDLARDRLGVRFRSLRHHIGWRSDRRLRGSAARPGDHPRGHVTVPAHPPVADAAVVG